MNKLVASGLLNWLPFLFLFVLLNLNVTKESSNTFTTLFVYVDDLILVGDFMTSLHNAFRIKDLAPLKYLLDFEVARSSK